MSQKSLIQKPAFQAFGYILGKMFSKIFSLLTEEKERNLYANNVAGIWAICSPIKQPQPSCGTALIPLLLAWSKVNKYLYLVFVKSKIFQG